MGRFVCSCGRRCGYPLPLFPWPGRRGAGPGSVRVGRGSPRVGVSRASGGGRAPRVPSVPLGAGLYVRGVGGKVGASPNPPRGRRHGTGIERQDLVPGRPGRRGPWWDPMGAEGVRASGPERRSARLVLGREFRLVVVLARLSICSVAAPTWARFFGGPTPARAGALAYRYDSPATPPDGAPGRPHCPGGCGVPARAVTGPGVAHPRLRTRWAAPVEERAAHGGAARAHFVPESRKAGPGARRHGGAPPPHVPARRDRRRGVRRGRAHGADTRPERSPGPPLTTPHSAPRPYSPPPNVAAPRPKEPVRARKAAGEIPPPPLPRSPPRSTPPPRHRFPGPGTGPAGRSRVRPPRSRTAEGAHRAPTAPAAPPAWQPPPATRPLPSSAPPPKPSKRPGPTRRTPRSTARPPVRSRPAFTRAAAAPDSAPGRTGVSLLGQWMSARSQAVAARYIRSVDRVSPRRPHQDTTISPYGTPPLNGRDAANYAGFTDVPTRRVYEGPLG
jgi:hypothetical protein